jgi:cadmium resistance protein CadD (predicted permease)
MNGFAYSGAIDVAIVTFVNGADNIGIYTPLFAVSDARRLIVLVAVLYVLLAAWCIVGYVIHRQKTVAYSLQRWGIGPCPQFLSALAFTSW